MLGSFLIFIISTSVTFCLNRRLLINTYLSRKITAIRAGFFSLHKYIVYSRQTKRLPHLSEDTNDGYGIASLFSVVLGQTTSLTTLFVVERDAALTSEERGPLLSGAQSDTIPFPAFTSILAAVDRIYGSAANQNG